MLVFIGHRMLVTLRDGSAVQGRLSWCWAWGFWRLTGAESLDGDQPQPIAGSVLIPKSSVLIAQVM